MTVAGGDLVVIGGSNKFTSGPDDDYSDVWRLSCSNGINNCQWSTLPNLPAARANFVAITIPDDFVTCS